MAETKPHFVFMRLMPPVIVWGGLEKLMLDWFERIDFSRCRATLIVSTGGGEVYTQHFKEKNLPIDVVEFPFRVNFQYVDNFFVRFFKTLKLLRQLKPDQVVFFQGSFFCFDLSHVLAANISTHGHTYMCESLGAPEPTPRSSKKYFGFIPGVGLWWYAEHFLTPLRARFCKRIIAVSKEIRERAVTLWHYPPDKVTVVYHGADVRQFFPAEDQKLHLRQSLGIASDELVFIAVARLSQEKCIDRAIEAFDILWREYPNSRFLIGGNGPLDEKLKDQAARQASGKKIQFLGYVHNSPELYRLSDAYILSSDNEGMSLAFLEALASGLICVSTKCTGSTEVLQDGINGFLVEKSVAAVAEGMRKVAHLSPDARRTISENAARHIREHFEINVNIKRALTLLEIPQT